MSVEHMVWIKFKPEITKERIAHHIAGLKTMVGKVPGLLTLSIGENFTQRAAGHTLGLIATLESRAALIVYADHPEHTRISKPLAADSESIMAMDFEH